jgi:hypothetical protein
MDHIIDVPSFGTAKYHAVFVVVYRSTKMAHFVPCHVTNSATTLTHLFLREVIHLHGLPVSIISNQGTMLCFHFWTTLGNKLSINVKMSAAFYPQTGGQL